MKVLTIKQPYASLIAAGLKEYEFRTWKTKFRGELLIHAGKGVDKKAMQEFADYGLEYPSGCIIAKVRISDCITVDDEFKNKLRHKSYNVYAGVIDDSEWQGYAFKIENVEKIKPIFINGKLGMWECDSDNL